MAASNLDPCVFPQLEGKKGNLTSLFARPQPRKRHKPRILWRLYAGNVRGKRIERCRRNQAGRQRLVITNQLSNGGRRVDHQLAFCSRLGTGFSEWRAHGWSEARAARASSTRTRRQCSQCPLCHAPPCASFACLLQCKNFSSTVLFLPDTSYSGSQWPPSDVEMEGSKA